MNTELETESLKIEIRNAKMLGKTFWADQNRKSRSLLETWASNSGKKKKPGHDVNIHQDKSQIGPRVPIIIIKNKF